MKRFFAVLFLLVALLPLSVYAADSDDALIQRGYPQDYLGSLIDEQKEWLWEFAEGYDVECIFTREIKPVTSYEPYVTVAVASVKRDRYLITVDYSWAATPSTCEEDYVAVPWDETQFGFYGEFIARDWAKSDGIWQCTAETTDYELTPYGVLYYCTPTPDTEALCGTAHFLVTTHSGTTVETANFDSIKAGYFHALSEEEQLLQDREVRNMGLKYVGAILLILFAPVIGSLAKSFKKD